MSKRSNNLEWGATHNTLVQRAKKWLKNQHYWGIVAELKTYSAEIPDAIGWKHHESCMLDCKASHSDFLADKHKESRKLNKMMGNLRYYMCPPSVIQPDELTNGWGLLYAYPNEIKVIVKAQRNDDLATYRQEHIYLLSMVRRFEIRYGMNPITEPLSTGNQLYPNSQANANQDKETANEQES